MAIPIVTFLVFILVSLMYYAIKETMLSQSTAAEVRSHSFLRFLRFAVIFIGLFSSVWLTAAVTLPLGRFLSLGFTFFTKSK